MFEFANTVEASRIYSRTRLTPRLDAVAKAAAIGDGCPARQSAPASRQQRIDKRPAGHRGANSWNQSCGRGALEDEATHAGGQRLLQMGFVFVGGQDQNLDRGSLLANLSRKDDPVHFRHADVDHRHIRGHRSHQAQRLQANCRLANQFEIRLSREDDTRLVEMHWKARREL